MTARLMGFPGQFLNVALRCVPAPRTPGKDVGSGIVIPARQAKLHRISLVAGPIRLLDASSAIVIIANFNQAQLAFTEHGAHRISTHGRLRGYLVVVSGAARRASRPAKRS